MTAANEVEVTIDGEPRRVAVGTSVAAAILNTGRAAFRTSVTGEARAALCGMGICFECRVTIDGQAHRRSCQEPCTDGMKIETRADAGATRARAVEWARHSVEIAVVGAGPAGIAAAVRAAETGADVLLVDDNPSTGGQIWRKSARRDGALASSARKRAWLERLGATNVRVLGATAIVHAEREATGGVRLVADRRGQPVDMRARCLVLATGARERFVPFPGWTQPGVVGVGGLQALLKSGLEIQGRRVAFAGSGPLMLAVAAAVRAAGGHVVSISEQASFARVAKFGASLWNRPQKLVQLAQLKSKIRRRVHYGEIPTRIEAIDGGLRLELSNRRGATRSVEADWVATGFGLVPETRIAQLLGCADGDGGITVDDEQRTACVDVFAAGECTGVGGVDVALVEGEIAGLVAAGRDALDMAGRRRSEHRFAQALERAFAPEDSLAEICTPETVVCRCEDVPFEAVAPRISMRDAKLQTRCGMGPCQGRVCGPALELIRGFTPDRVRSPLFPVAMGQLVDSTAEDVG